MEKIEHPTTSDAPIAGREIPVVAADLVRRSFEAYRAQFLAITGRAESRFEKREWAAVLADAEERIDLYHHCLDIIEPQMRDLLAERVHDYGVWESTKSVYCKTYLATYHADMALIYFYSVMRRLFLETGDSIEYSDDEIRRSVKAEVAQDPNRPIRNYPADSPEDVTPELIRQIVEDYRFQVACPNLDEDARLSAEMLRPELKNALRERRIDRIEMLKSAFFRNKAAYLIGRIVSGSVIVPLVLVLLNPPEGLVIDGVLSQETDLSNIFSSARSNFHTNTSAYREVFEFLESIAPTRPKAYIYTSIGFIHPGKLQLVHELRNHLAKTHERFGTATGVPGTVMIVFALPTFSYVFKVIRDVSTKPTFRGRGHVVGQYWRVHRMDRVGRMLDIMTFHNLRFAQSSFDAKLLDELLRDAPSSARIEDSYVVFRYLYAARQITPLDVYLADPNVRDEAKSRAAIDYGYAIKDLAAAGSFVGDYLPKNFGVNRLGRVILYDYDDLDHLVSWHFRALPEPPAWAETLPYDDWLSRGERDVFPDHDFRIFTVPAHGGPAFLKHHADLLDPEYWNAIKGELTSGTVPEFYPYPMEKRLRPTTAGSDTTPARHVNDNLQPNI
jgi:isocitrate dehydrogenase kinase/phosphatase